MKPAEVIDLKKVNGAPPVDTQDLVRRFRDEERGPHERKLFIARILVTERFLQENTPERIRAEFQRPAAAFAMLKAVAMIMSREEFPELYFRLEAFEELMAKAKISVNFLSTAN